MRPALKEKNQYPARFISYYVCVLPSPVSEDSEGVKFDIFFNMSTLVMDKGVSAVTC